MSEVTTSGDLPYKDRIDAAQRLAAALANYRGRNPLVLVIPRGAIGMGRVIAEALDGELDVVLVRKLRAPFNRELALGAVDEAGAVVLSESAARLGVDESYLTDEARAQSERIHERRARYGGDEARIDPAGRLVIVVDDGLATGATMVAALRSLRVMGAGEIVAAVPVAAADSALLVGGEADTLVCLATPEPFVAVSQFYREFPQVEDDEVVAELKAWREQRAGAR